MFLKRIDRIRLQPPLPNNDQERQAERPRIQLGVFFLQSSKGHSCRVRLPNDVPPSVANPGGRLRLVYRGWLGESQRHTGDLELQADGVVGIPGKVVNTASCRSIVATLDTHFATTPRRHPGDRRLEDACSYAFSGTQHG